MHRTVTKLFIRDIYLCKFLDFKSIHEHEKYISTYALVYLTLSSVWSFLLSTHSVDLHLLLYVHHVNSALFVLFTALIVPFCSVHRINSALFVLFTALIVPFFFRSSR